MKKNIAKPEETKSSCYCNNKAKKTKLMFQERQKVSPQEKRRRERVQIQIRHNGAR